MRQEGLFGNLLKITGVGDFLYGVYKLGEYYTNQQYNLIKESEESILRIPTLSLFDNDWDLLQRYMEKKGNPKYSIEGDLDLRGTAIESLGSLQSVGGDLDLYETPIESLENLQSVGGYLSLYGTPIKSLGNLQSVGGNLNLYGTPIESLGNLQSVGGGLNLERTQIKSLGNLQSVGGYLYLGGTQISKKYSEQEIRDMVNVNGGIYL